MKRACVNRRGRDRRGATAMEVAITLVVLMSLILGFCEYGRLMMVRQLMENASREGARYAVVGATSGSNAITTSQIQTFVTNYLAGQLPGTVTVQVYWVDSATGNNLGAWNTAPIRSDIAVQVDYSYAPMVPYVMPSPLPLRSRTVMRSESN